MKIFRMGQFEWYAAENAEDALRAMADDQGFPASPEGLTAMRKEFGFDEPGELGEESMDWYKYFESDEDGNAVEGAAWLTFRERLAQMMAAGDEFPCLFGSSEY